MSRTLIDWRDDDPNTAFEIRVHGIIRRLAADSKQAGLQSSLIAVLYPPPSDRDDPVIQIQLSLSHELTYRCSNALDGSTQHPLHQVVCMSGGLGQLTQGFQLHCPACGYVSTTLHNHRQLQQALSGSHPDPNSGRPCNHVTKLHKELDLLRAHPATHALSTAPQQKAHQDPQHAAAEAGRSSSRRRSQGQADNTLSGDLMDKSLARRVMGVIVANVAMHIISMTSPNGRGKAANDGAAGQRLLPWRKWAVDTLTESVDVIEAANWVRPSFATLLAALTMPAPAADPDSQSSPSTALGSSTGAVSILDLLLAPPWAAVSELHAIENMTLERLAAFLKQWFGWLQQHVPSEAEAAVAALSKNGYMLSARTAGLQLLLEGLLGRDPAFKHHPAATRLQHFLACAGISGSVDAVLIKLDVVIRTKTHITSHLEACAYCGMSSAKLRVYCKASGGKKVGKTDSTMCKCSHCIVAVCVPCVLAAAGVQARDQVAHGSIGEAEAAEAAAHWPDGLCYWCSSAEQGLHVSPAASPQKAAAPARAELLLEQQDAAGAVVGAAARSAADAGQQRTSDRARQAAAAAFPQPLLQQPGDEAVQAAVEAFPPQQQLLQEALNAVLSAFGSQSAGTVQPQGGQAAEADTEPALGQQLAQHKQTKVLQQQNSHASSADGSGGAPAAAAASGAGTSAGRCITDDSAVAVAANWFPSSATTVRHHQQEQEEQQQQHQLTYWASDDLDAAELPQQPPHQLQLGEGRAACAAYDSAKAQVAAAEVAAAAAAAAEAVAAEAAGEKSKGGVRKPRCGSCHLHGHNKRTCYAIESPPGFKRKMEQASTESGHRQKKPKMLDVDHDTAAPGGFELTTVQMPALSQQQHHEAQHPAPAPVPQHQQLYAAHQHMAPAPVPQQPLDFVECTYATDDAGADLFELHGACVTRRRSSSVGKAHTNFKLDALAAAAAGASSGRTTVAPVFAPAAGLGGHVNSNDILQQCMQPGAAAVDDTSPDVTSSALAASDRLRNSRSRSMGAGASASAGVESDVGPVDKPDALTDLDTAVYTALSAAASRLSGARAGASAAPGQGQGLGHAAASGGTAQGADEAREGASSGAAQQDEPPAKAPKRCATCIVNSWSFCGTDEAHEHCLRRLQQQQQQQLQDAEQQQLQEGASEPRSSVEPSDALHIQPSEQDLHAKFTQLMQALLGADGPFARQVAGTLAMGVAAGVATGDAWQGQGAAADGEGLAAAGLEQPAAAAEGSPAPPHPDAAAGSAGKQGAQGAQCTESSQGLNGRAAASGSGRPRKPPVYKPKPPAARQQGVPAAAGADWGLDFGAPPGLKPLLDPAVEAGAWAAAAGGDAGMQDEQHSSSVMTCFDEQEQQALMALLDMRHLKEEQQCRRQQQQQQARDQGAVRGSDAGAQQAQSWWLEQQQRLQQVQQEADWGLLPAASVTWPWDGQAPLSHGQVVTTERGTPEAEAEAIAATRAMLAAAAGLLHPAATAAGFLDPAAAAAAPVSPAALAAPISAAAAAAAPVIEDPASAAGVPGAAGASGGAVAHFDGAPGAASGTGFTFGQGNGVHVPWAVAWSHAELSEHDPCQLMYRHQVIQEADRPTRRLRQVTTLVRGPAAAAVGGGAAAAVLDDAKAAAAPRTVEGAAGDGDGPESPAAEGAAGDGDGPESPAAVNRRGLIALCEEAQFAAAAAGVVPTVTDSVVPDSAEGALGEMQAGNQQQQPQGNAAAAVHQQQQAQGSAPASVPEGAHNERQHTSNSAQAFVQQGFQQQQTQGSAPAEVQEPHSSYQQMLEAAAVTIFQQAAANNIMQQSTTINILQHLLAQQQQQMQAPQSAMQQQQASGPQSAWVQDLEVQALALGQLPSLRHVPQAQLARPGIN